MILYLSMDVVDASFGQLRGAIVAARDFSAADAAHRQYVDSLVSQVRSLCLFFRGRAQQQAGRSRDAAPSPCGLCALLPA